MWLKNDSERYKYLVVLHLICSVAFALRFILICTDLSSAQSDSIAYPVIILLLELASSFITLIANVFYVFLRYFGPILFESDRENIACCSQAFAWSLSTLTCIRCECHRNHPQSIMITRCSVLLVFELFRFTAFILACVCANKYGPTGLGYAILAGFSMVPAVFLLVVEYLHYYRLWFHYRPDTSSEKQLRYAPEHRGFLPLDMTNDEQTSHWQNSRCEKGQDCSSQSLYHAMMYHSGNTRYAPERTGDNQIVIGFHQTSHKAAYSIAQTKLKPSKTGWIGPGIYFATSLNHTEFKANQFGAYICAKVDLGKTKRIKHPREWSTGESYDTVYYEHPKEADEFCVHTPNQIRSWIIVVDQNPNVKLLKAKHNEPISPGKYVEDELDDGVYHGCWI